MQRMNGALVIGDRWLRGELHRRLKPTLQQHWAQHLGSF